MIAKVYISPKREVLDPQGQVVESGLHSLGFAHVSDVRVGKLIEIDLGDIDEGAAREQVEDMCRRFLANPIIEDFRFDLIDGLSDGSA